MKKLLMGLSLLLVVTTYSCKKKDDTITEENNEEEEVITPPSTETLLCTGNGGDEIIPLTPGNKWIHTDYLFGGVSDALAISEDDSTEQDGIVFYAISGGGLYTVFLNHLGYNSAGDLFHMDSGDGPRVLIPNPSTLSVGMGWRTHDYTGTDSLVVVSLTDTLTIESCTYTDVIVLDGYSTYNNWKSHSLYFKKGLGFIKHIYHDTPWGIKIEEIRDVVLK